MVSAENLIFSDSRVVRSKLIILDETKNFTFFFDFFNIYFIFLFFLIFLFFSLIEFLFKIIQLTYFYLINYLINSPQQPH